MSNPGPPRSPTSRQGDSQSTHIPPASTLRLVQDDDDTDTDTDIDVYAASPYPTKPQQILQPTAGSSSSQGYSRTEFYEYEEPRRNTVRVSYSSQEPPSASTVSSSVDSWRDTLEGPPTGGSMSEFSSFGQDSGSTSQIWLHDEKSSKTSLVHTPVPETLEEEGEEVRSQTSESTVPLPHSTIKTVIPSSPQSTPSASGTVIRHSPPSGASTPNIVPFTSSPNLVAVGSSSPNVVKTQTSNSSLYSSNTFGTARRYWVDRERQDSQTPPVRTPVASYVYSDVQDSNSPSESIPSSPPSAILRAFRSNSTISLPPLASAYHARPRASSKTSTPSPSDEQSIGSLALQFPRVRAPSSTVSWVESFSRSISQRSRQMPDRSGAQNPHLFSSDSSDGSQGPITQARPLSFGTTVTSGISSFEPNQQTLSVGNDESDESSDRLGRLRSLSHASGLPGASRSSSLSRLSSFRSNRPGSSASAAFHILPTWARVYYQTETLPFQLSAALSFVEGSRPSTAAGEPAELVSPLPAEITRPRTRARQIVYPDPRDPRAHWRDGMEIKEIGPAPTDVSDVDLRTWSPHLKRDKGVPPTFNKWKPASLDESAEPLFSWRNLQIVCFVFGFIFPLAWMFASFMPLPERPVLLSQQPSTLPPDVEKAPQDSPPGTPSTVDFARYESTRWWRRVNRILTPVGLIIIAVIIILAVLGTRGIL